MTGRVAQLRSLGNATTQLGEERATGVATGSKATDPISPMTGRELRAQLRAQLDRNRPPQQPIPEPDEVAMVAMDFRLSTRGRAREADDDRRTCAECGNLSTRGQCLAAWRGEARAWPWFAPQTYHPVADVPHYCPSFRPLVTDTDQRNGAERWPYLSRSGGDREAR
jgi:hypothetical protein